MFGLAPRKGNGKSSPKNVSDFDLEDLLDWNMYLLKPMVWGIAKACCKANDNYYLLVQAIVPVSRSEYHVSFDVKPDFVLMSPGGRLAHCWFQSREDRLTALV